MPFISSVRFVSFIVEFMWSVMLLSGLISRSYVISGVCFIVNVSVVFAVFASSLHQRDSGYA